MKVAIFKKKDGGINLGRICDINGNIAYKGDIEAHLQSVVEGNEDFISYRIADTSNLPGGGGYNYDPTFFEAFTDDLEGEQIDIDLEKAKLLKAHPARRKLRSENFKPVDGDTPYAALSPDGEALRKSIKNKDDQLQIDIDSAVDEKELRDVMINGGLL